MFDAVRNNKRIVQVFLGLITLPFAFWGVDSYIRNVNHDADVAKVGSVAISQQRFQQAMREQLDRLRQTYGGSVDPKMLDNPEARRAVLDGLIDQQLLLQEVRKGRLFVSDAALREVIGSIPALQEDGKFSMQRYEQALAERNLTREGFEAQMRQDMSLQQLVGGVGESAILSQTVARQLTQLQVEERQVQGYVFAPATYAAQVKVGDTEVKDYYDKNAKQFETPEQVRVEYVVMSPEAIAGQVKVSDDAVRQAYEEHKDRYLQPEERRASHILITVATGASDADKAKAKAQAEAVLKEVQANPGKFAELARKNSRDPGSAQKGGDLGYFDRKTMVKPFTDATWALKEGEISGLVQSDFGYHIIKLTGIRGGKPRDFSEVRNEIAAELAKQEAARQFAEAADNFNNMVYEQADSLKPVEERYKLTAQQSGWLTRQGGANAGPLADPKLLAAIFSDDAINQHRNTAAVEIAQNTLVAAHVIEHKAAAQQPLESVRAQIVEQLRREGAQALARKAGEEKLAALKSGKGGDVNWGAVATVSRINPRPLQASALAAVFKLDSGKLPAYTGQAMDDGSYVLFKLVKVAQPEKLDTSIESAISGQLANILAQEEGRAYIAALRQRYKVEVNEALLNTAQQEH